MKKYDVLMFDVGGVLLDHKEERHYKNISEELKLPIRETSVLGSKLARELERRNITMTQVEQTIKQKFDITNPSKVKGVWSRNFKKSIKPDPRMLDLVERLYKKNYKIAISTNTNLSDYKILYGKDGILRSLRKYHIFASCYMNLAKPDPKYYQYILESLKCSPEKAIFVDDNKRNVQMAMKIGIYSILFVGYEKLDRNLRTLGVKY